MNRDGRRWVAPLVNVGAAGYERKRSFPAQEMAAAGRHEHYATYARACAPLGMGDVQA